MDCTVFQECTSGHESGTSRGHLSYKVTVQSRSATGWSYTVENLTGFYRVTSGNTTSVNHCNVHHGVITVAVSGTGTGTGTTGTISIRPCSCSGVVR